MAQKTTQGTKKRASGEAVRLDLGRGNYLVIRIPNMSPLAISDAGKEILAAIEELEAEFGAGAPVAATEVGAP